MPPSDVISTAYRLAIGAGIVLTILSSNMSNTIRPSACVARYTSRPLLARPWMFTGSPRLFLTGYDFIWSFGIFRQLNPPSSVPIQRFP